MNIETPAEKSPDASPSETDKRLYPPSRQGKKAVTVYLDPAEHRALQVVAVMQNIRLHTLIRTAVLEYMARQPPVASPPVLGSRLPD